MFIVHGTYMVSNAGGYEIQLSADGSQARIRDAFGSDDPKVSGWLDIETLEYLEQDENEVTGFGTCQVIDPGGYDIPLNEVIKTTNF